MLPGVEGHSSAQKGERRPGGMMKSGASTRAAEALQTLLRDRVPAGTAAAVAVQVDDDQRTAGTNIGEGQGSTSSGSAPIFLAYSITKSFIATLVLQLCAERRLDLDLPLSQWLPRVPRAAEISLRALLNHTAGIPDYRSLPEYHRAVAASPSTPWTFDEFADHTYAKGLAFPPGQGWDYSNPGYMLLRRVLELATDDVFPRLLTFRILAPLGLHNTFVAESIADLASLVPGCSKLVTTTGESVDVRTVYHPGWVSHGVLASTPGDLVTFYHSLFSGVLLPADLFAAMTTLVPVPKQTPSRWGRPGYGLGIMGDAASRHGVLWGHNGEGPGYAASAFHAQNLRGRRATVCAMCAAESSDFAADLVFATLDLLEDLRQGLPPQAWMPRLRRSAGPSRFTGARPHWV